MDEKMYKRWRGMENNLFDRVQLRHLYKDKNFANFLADYFSSYDTDILGIDGDMNSDFDAESWKIYMRILLANVNDVLISIGKIEKNISFSYEEVKVRVSGGIKGRLLINEYVQNKSMIRMPREYPCEIKEKSFPDSLILCLINEVPTGNKNLIIGSPCSFTLLKIL